MPSVEHVEVLMTGGVKGWNQWRNENPDVRPDLSGVKIGEPMIRINLSGSNVSNSLLGPMIVAADFRKAKMVCAEFVSGDGSMAKFDEANLEKAWLSDTKFIGASFNGTNLAEAKLKRANFFKCVFHNAILNRGNLTNTSFKDVAFDGSD